MALHRIDRGLVAGGRAMRQDGATPTFVGPGSLDDVVQEHGGALLSLARWMLSDAEAAETVVVEVLGEAFTPPGPDPVAGNGSLRYVLARMTFLRCLGYLPTTSLPPATALALCRFGDCSYRQAGALVGMAEADVPSLLEADLRGLSLLPRRSA